MYWLVRALRRNRRATSSIPATDLKLHFSQVSLVRSSKCTVYKFPLNNFHQQHPSTIYPKVRTFLAIVVYMGITV